MNNILSIDEVRNAIKADFDHPQEELQRYQQLASSYLFTKTGYDFGKEETIEPLAKQAAIIYIKSQHFSGSKYNKDFNYSIGLESLIYDLQGIASSKLAAEEAAALIEEEVVE